MQKPEAKVDGPGKHGGPEEVIENAEPERGDFIGEAHKRGVETKGDGGNGKEAESEYEKGQFDGPWRWADEAIGGVPQKPVGKKQHSLRDRRTKCNFCTQWKLSPH